MYRLTYLIVTTKEPASSCPKNCLLSSLGFLMSSISLFDSELASHKGRSILVPAGNIEFYSYLLLLLWLFPYNWDIFASINARYPSPLALNLKVQGMRSSSERMSSRFQKSECRVYGVAGARFEGIAVDPREAKASKVEIWNWWAI